MTYMPHSWAWVTLGEVCIKPQYGYTTKARHGVSDGLKLLRTTDITSGKINWHEVPVCTNDPDDLSKYLLHDGDIVVSRAGSVGASILLRDPPQSVFASYLIRLRTLTGISAHYVSYYLKSTSFWQQISEVKSGIALSNVNAKKLATIQLPMPPSREQDRIVTQIESMLSQIDKVERSLQTVFDKLGLLRQAILIYTFYTDLKLPGSWNMITIGKVAEVQLGRQRSPKYHTGRYMRPYLRAANITWDGFRLNDVKEMNFDDTDFDRYRLRSEDLLLNEASGSPNEVGKPAIWNSEIADCCFQNTLLRVRSDIVELRYLYWYCYLSAKTGGFGRASRGVNIRHLGKRGLSQFPIPVAPRDEQKRIVHRLDEQSQKIATLEQSIRIVLSRVAALRQSVLADAFAGRLVPQDPDDEPASVLLERIAASRPAKPARRK